MLVLVLTLSVNTFKNMSWAPQLQFRLVKEVDIFTILIFVLTCVVYMLI